MSHSKIRKALNDVVRAYCTANNIPVFLENIVANPVTSKPFFKTFCIPASTTANTLGGDNKRYQGLYQIQICVPANEGTRRVTEYLDELQELFPIFGRIVFNTTTGDYITLMSPLAMSRGDASEGVYYTPVTLTYRADTL